MKQCSKCKTFYPRTAQHFRRHAKEKGGLNYWCKHCSYENERLWRKNNPEKANKLRRIGVERYVKRYPEKRKAQSIVASAVRSKWLRQKPCVICGNLKAQAHHDDYSKPLDVVWLCVAHHKEWEEWQAVA